MHGRPGHPFLILLLALLAWFGAELARAAGEGQPSAFRSTLTQEEQAWLDVHPVIIVGNGPDFPPYYGWDPQGHPTGPVGQYLAALETHAGLRFQHRRLDNFDGVLTALRDGGIDLIPALTPTESRKRLFRFTGAYLHSPAVLVTRQLTPPVTLPFDLAGVRIAVERGHASEEILRRTRPKAQLVLTDGTETALQAVAGGHADAYLGMEAAVAQYLGRPPLQDLRVRRRFEGDLSGMAMAVRQDQPILHAILSKAMAAQGPVAGPPPPAPGNPAGFSLTPEEQAWLLAHGPIRAGYDEAFYPLSYKAANGQGDGYALQLFRHLRDMAGLAVDERGGAWGDILRQARQGELDVLVASARTPDRNDQLLFVGPYLAAPTVVVSRDGEGQIWDLGELRGKRLALLKDHFLTPRIQAAYPAVQLIATPHQEDALDAVAQGRADAAIGNLHAVNRLIQQRYLGKLFIAGHIPDGDSELYLAVSRQAPLLASILQRALESLSPEELAIARSRWLDTQYQPGIAAGNLARSLLPVFLFLAAMLLASALGNRRLRKEVAARRRVEDRLAERSRELEHANRELEAFSYSVAHDLKAPVRHVAGYAHLLEEALILGQQAEARQLVGRIRKASLRQEALIEGVLSLARAARAPLEAQDVDLSELAQEAWAQLISEDASVQAVRFHCEPGLRVRGDPTLLACLIANLLSNAAKFCRHQAHARVSLVPDQPPRPGCFEVRDNGVGIPENEAANLFQPFSRLSTARGTEGSGIGLATVRRIVERHGGTIEARNLPGGGACFRVCLGHPPASDQP
ncbi:MAG: transporter substrate-binding domain-containing protein [Rhodocyclaceae bacterium]|jgi:signal transduction histidine kinase|nr:transporter substrate-binding domain-containing protein [Rhodocyclaceae bacterium]